MLLKRNVASPILKIKKLSNETEKTAKANNIFLISIMFLSIPDFPGFFDPFAALTLYSIIKRAEVGINQIEPSQNNPL